MTADAVVLIPGFLGVGRVGRFFYFSERILAALRAAVEARTGRDVLVVACASRPAGSLQARQVFLLEQLSRLCGQAPDLERIHLVGHSTGGVDAQLLTCDRPVGGESWEPYALARSKIASVAAVAAPQHGTSLARAAVFHLLRGRRFSLPAVASMAALSTDLVRMLWGQPEVGDVLDGARAQLPETLAFLAELVRHRELLSDLDPGVMAALRQRVKPEGRVPLTSFVTVAGMSDSAARGPDRFFRDLHAMTAGHAVPGPASLAALERLRKAPGWISGSGQPLATVDERANDGVIDSALQLLDPTHPAELGGVVVADHADVIGHYDRPPGMLDPRPLQVGLFHSGSGFTDRCFFNLYGLVAQAVCRAIPDADSRPALATG